MIRRCASLFYGLQSQVQLVDQVANTLRLFRL